AGNHDRYSGGRGYLELLARLGQPASYFCLQNQAWQLLAGDTGLHDRDPKHRHANVTSLEEGELGWHLDKITRFGASRGTITLSPCSASRARAPPRAITRATPPASSPGTRPRRGRRCSRRR